VLAYHDATKHHPHGYAKGPGRLDWATQPDPFRRYEGAAVVSLLLGGDEPEPLYDEILSPGAVSPRPLNRRSISAFFECSLGLTAWKSYRGTSWSLRCNPSSGNLHPTEGYLLAGPIEGIGATPAVYHYAPREHALERRHEIGPAVWQRLMQGLGDSAFLVGLTSIYWREAWKYGERAFRYCQHDAGHALACLRFAAAMSGWRLRVIEESGDADIGRLLGVDREGDYSDAERENPDLTAVVTPTDRPLPATLTLDPDAIDAVAGGAWFGRANPLSGGHVSWDLIDEASEATEKPRGLPMAMAWQPRKDRRSEVASAHMEGESHGGGPTARQIVLQRRSGTDYDGETAITAPRFYGMLQRLMPIAAASGRPVPWDAISWPPTVHLFLFVHRVADLPSGIYGLARDALKVEELRAATRKEFAWQPVKNSPAGLPFFMLMQTDCRHAAARLSLGQEIAADGAFSLAMIAEFERPLREYGPWFYRRLFWEAGMVGQVLYMEAEALGARCRANIRGTGMGAYFDDWVHETLGLEGHAFQDLYHFTVGGAVDDDRLTTLPPYDAAATRT